MHRAIAGKTDGESLAQLKAGKLAADLEDFPAAQYTVKTAGGGNDFELLGEPTGRTPYGIGIAKARYMAWEQSAEVLGWQKRLKRLWDPRELLNPGKIFT